MLTGFEHSRLPGEEIKNNVLIVDFNQVAFSNYFINRSQIDDKNFWKYLVLKSFKTMIEIIHPDEMILAVDSKSWRKELYSFYKGNRKKDKNIEVLYGYINEFIQELRDNFPYKIVQVSGAEGDDIMSVLTQSLDDIITLATNDKDLRQLSYCVFFDPIKNEFISEDFDKKLYLTYMILKGDTGDGICNILSDDNTLITKGKRQNKLTSKKIEEILEQGIEYWVEKQDEKIKSNYKRNKTLIDLSLNNIPKDIQERILKNYWDNKPINSYEKVYDYFIERDMRTLINDVNTFLLKVPEIQVNKQNIF